MMARVLDGKATAATIKAEVAGGVEELKAGGRWVWGGGGGAGAGGVTRGAGLAGGVEELKAGGRSVRLDVVLAGDDPASVTYVRHKETDAEEVGITSRVHRFPKVVSQEELTALVDRLNDDPEVSGFIVQR